MLYLFTHVLEIRYHLVVFLHISSILHTVSITQDAQIDIEGAYIAIRACDSDRLSVDSPHTTNDATGGDVFE